MDNIKSAQSLFKKGFSCSQAVLSEYGDRFGLDNKLALKISSAFGGGMAHMGDTCGAVTGALMVIGLKYGRVDAKDKAAKEKTYKLAREFIDKFRDRNSSIVCRELLGLDIDTTEGERVAKNKKLFKTVCPGFVKDATEILDELLIKD